MFNCAKHYRAYDFVCRSEISLPELETTHSDEFDVDIVVSTRRERIVGGTNAELKVTVDCETIRLFHPDVASFGISSGRRIGVEPVEYVDSLLLRFFLLGPAMGTLLRQRGHLVLHASAISSDRGAVIFAGATGAGKSTLAAAMGARGYQVLADDVTAIDALMADPVVFPAFSHTKLDSRAAAAIGLSYSRDAPTSMKEYIATRRIESHAPVPLRRIFILEDAEVSRIEVLSPRAAFTELLRHTYGARPLQCVDRERHFRQCATIARNVPVRRLFRRSSLTALPALAAVVENDLTNNK